MKFEEYISRIYELYTNSQLDLLMYIPAKDEDFYNLKHDYKNLIGELETWWRISNGSKPDQCFFSIFTDELTPAHFWSISESIEFLEYLHQEDYQSEFCPQKSERDKRIKSGWKNKKWLPFAGFNGFATVIMLDNDPTSFGNSGQVIAYQHDPDAIYYVADSLSDFLDTSFSLVEKSILPRAITRQ